jgi:hypothetical protein
MYVSAKRSVPAVEFSEVSPSVPSADTRDPNSLETRVTLSSAARQQQASPSQPRATSKPRDIASEDAHSDPKVAERFAHDAAFMATGEPYTPEFEAKFKARAAEVREQRIALYESEKAKGTPPADIFDKLQAFFEALPKDYRDLVRSNGDAQSSILRAVTSGTTSSPGDLQDVEKTAHDLAYIEDEVHLDATDWINGTGPLRVKATGEPYTPEFEAKFKIQASKIRQDRIAVYESEKAKGTLASDILSRLEDMFNALPKDYQDLVRSKGD